ncbi:MAG TPA: N-acetyltransferase [Candidatus Limnocylindrales bacterium]|nr:N-acetyltransferase [Candidatus Limnocylindrales bacterium]
MHRVRPATAGDLEAICRIHQAAFATGAEARLVAALVRAGQDRISLVAQRDETVVGHVLMSPVAIAGRSDISTALGLAPLAVLPRFQRLGAGAALVRAGLEQARLHACSFCVVLGNPAYYARFGFVPASRFGLACLYTDGDQFMVAEVQPGGLAGVRGLVTYAPQFAVLDE